MKLDDTIIQKYLSGDDSASYCDHWIYKALGRGNVFEEPKPSDSVWVKTLYEKLKNQIENYVPRNYKIVKEIFPDFDNVTNNYTIIFAVGFPDPYDAMVLSHNGKDFMVFDLIQFGIEALNENYNCHRVLTHELIHMCLHNTYPCNQALSYADLLSYTAFDEGFAHALTYPEDIESFKFDIFLQEKYDMACNRLKQALEETDAEKKKEYIVSADTGKYWDKYAAISGKLFILKNTERIKDIYNSGWKGFADKIIFGEVL